MEKNCENNSEDHDDNDEDYNDDEEDVFSMYTSAANNMKNFRKKHKLDFPPDKSPPKEQNTSISNDIELSDDSLSPSKILKSSPLEKSTSSNDEVHEISDDEESNTPIHLYRTRSSIKFSQHQTTPKAVPPARGRGRGRRARGGRGRGRGRGAVQEVDLLGLDKPPEIYKPLVSSNWTLDDTTSLDDSLGFEDDNYEILLKVLWRSDKLHKIPIRKYQKMTSIFEYFANLEGVSQSNVIMMLHDKIISSEDTPEKLKLTIANIIEGGISSLQSTSTARVPSPVDLDSIELKVRTQNSKIPTMIRIKKTQKMIILMTKFSEQTEIPLEKLKFSFDGDAINPGETPEDLDLEGGEMIDLVVAN